MKKLAFVISLMLFTGMVCLPQDSIYILHPVIGEIIDRNEKIDFNLFPEIATSKFEYSYIQQTGGTFWLNSHVYPDSLILQQLDTADIHQLARDIEKKAAANPGLIRTHTGKGEYRSVVVKPADADQSSQKILYPEMIERIGSETISNERLKDDAENQKLWRQGSNLDNNSMLIDFSYRKKKKK
jgi:hypothetical protein